MANLPQAIYDTLQAGISTLRDPGDAGEIESLSGLAIVELVTAGAETRTVAAPSNLPVGSLLLIVMKTDGGDGVVTFATGANATGNNTATFADAGDWVLCTRGYANNSSTAAWRVIASDGATLSTV